MRRKDPSATAGCRGARVWAWRFGRLAELACAFCLVLKGYRIIARDVRTPVGEIDLIARRGRTVAFIEVKARREGSGIEVLTPHQRRRIVRAARAFLQYRPRLAACERRFDVILVRPWQWPRHLTHAWRADE